MAFDTSGLPQVNLETHYLLAKTDEKGARFESAEKGLLGSIKVFLLTTFGGYDAKIDHVAQVVYDQVISKAPGALNRGEKQTLITNLEKFEEHEAKKLQPIQSQLNKLKQTSKTLREERRALMESPEQGIGPMALTGERSFLVPSERERALREQRIQQLNSDILGTEEKIKELQKEADEAGKYVHVFDATINTIKARQ